MDIASRRWERRCRIVARMVPQSARRRHADSEKLSALPGGVMWWRVSARRDRGPWVSVEPATQKLAYSKTGHRPPAAQPHKSGFLLSACRRRALCGTTLATILHLRSHRLSEERLYTQSG